MGLSTNDTLAEDILHVRLQTLGVKEHSFDINMGGINYNWLLYDVGGAVRIPRLVYSEPALTRTTMNHSVAK